MYLRALKSAIFATVLILVLGCVQARAQGSLPSVWTDGDVGSVGVAGSASFANGRFTMAGSGQWIYSTSDGFHFVYQPLAGDGSIVARVVSAQNNGTYEQAGVMIRETLNDDSANASMTFQTYSAGYLDFFYRSSAGASSIEASVAGAPPCWVKLTRSGSSFSAYSSFDGANWSQVGSTTTISMAQNVYIGLVLSSDSNSTLDQAVLDNVSVNSSSISAAVVSSVSPTSGVPGTSLTITGSGFGASQSTSQAYLNGAALTVNSWSDTSISATIPSSVTSGPLAISVGPSMNYSNPLQFMVLPNGWLDQDIGSVGVGGTSSYANNVLRCRVGVGASPEHLMGFISFISIFRRVTGRSLREFSAALRPDLKPAS
jgi:regulation of enolase protein 1 (concanavalin A-like superfamily)